MCHEAIVVEPLWFQIDVDGYHHWPFSDPPMRTVIDVHGLARLIGVTIIFGSGQVTIECDGKTIIYDRVGHTIHGHWICARHTESPDGIDG
jgi:hypothetical protein